MSDLTSGELVASLDELGGRVDRLRDVMNGKFTTARKALRRTNIMIAAIAVVFLLGLSAQWWQVYVRDQDRTDAAVTNCINGNLSRKLLIDYANDRVDRRINSLLDVVFALPGNTAATPEQAAQRAAAKEQIKASFAAEPAEVPAELGPRDCSVDAVTTPATLTPR